MSPAIQSRDERIVLSRYGHGEEIGPIAATGDFTHDFVNGVVSRLASYDRATARRLVREYDKRPAAEATPDKPKVPAIVDDSTRKRMTARRRTSAPAEDPAERERVATAVLDVTTKHAEEARADLDELNAVPLPAPAADGLTELLARGDASNDEQCRDLAGQIRGAIDALHTRLAEVAVEEQAQREAALARVAQARAELDAALAELAALNGHAPQEVAS